MKILILTIILVALAIVLLGVKVFFVKGGKFPNTHIHGNRELNKRGIRCARDDDFFK